LHGDRADVAYGACRRRAPVGAAQHESRGLHARALQARVRERESALRGVPGRLASIWNSERPAFLRRRAIFRMWDDCEEEGDGLQVRSQVIEFIQAQLPRNAPDAFTTEELRRFNAERDSTMEFDPY
jgi:hypothetical protein